MALAKGRLRSAVKQTRGILAAVLVCGGTVSGVHAVTLSFSFGGGGTDNVENPQALDLPTSNLTFGQAWQQTQSTAEGDLTLRVAPAGYTAGVSGTAVAASFGGQRFDGQTLGDNPRDPQSTLTQTAGGLGVMNNGTAGTDNAPLEVDGTSSGIFGAGWLDYLVVAFDRDVSLGYAQFSAFDASDQFRFIFDVDGQGPLGGAGDFLTDPLGAVLDAGGIATYAPAGGITFRRLGVAAIDRGSSWQFRELGVSFVGGLPDVSGATATIAPVPLPANGVLLMGALCGLGALRRFTR